MLKRGLAKTAPFAVMLSVALLSSLAEHRSATTRGGSSLVPPESELGLLATGKLLRNKDAQVRFDRNLLSELATEYTETRSEIAQETDEATQFLEHLGLDESQLVIMERMHRVAPTIGRYDKYGATLAMYLELRMKGDSPDEAESTIGRVDTWMERWTQMD